MRITLLLCSLTYGCLGFAQPFTQPQYAWRVETDQVYGVAQNYAGIQDTLSLDLYKPVGDDNLRRPLIVLVHGGAWIGGCKENMRWLAEAMAARGYVTASINYRKGWHKDDYVPNPVNPAVLAGINCLYAADSSEVLRAIYRGMQDVKGAIRWLKARSLLDSTCNQSVLVAGESVGAFLALTVGLLDRPEEKPDACYALNTLPPPGDNLSNCYDLNCITQNITPLGAALERPDLGSIEGELNLNGYDARVKGILSLYGVVPYEALTKNWLQGPDTPAVYFYHQLCDGVVPFGYGKPYFPISAYCNLGYTPWHPALPNIFGNGAIALAFGQMPDPPPFQTEWIDCPAFNPAIAVFDCLRFSQNGAYHFVHNTALVAQHAADFFSPVVSEILGSGSCLSGVIAPAAPPDMMVSPNPFRDKLSLQTREGGLHQLVLYNMAGQAV